MEHRGSTYDLIYVGRIDPEKNLTLLIELIGKVSERLGGVRACMVGSGKAQAEVATTRGGRVRPPEVATNTSAPPFGVAVVLKSSRRKGLIQQERPTSRWGVAWKRPTPARYQCPARSIVTRRVVVIVTPRIVIPMLDLENATVFAGSEFDLDAVA